MRQGLALAVALVLASACAGAIDPEPAQDRAAGPLVREMTSTPAAPRPSPTPKDWSAEARTACATAIVRGLVEAMNSAGQAGIEHIFREVGGEHPFQWVSMPLPSGHWVSYDASGAVETLLGRSAGGERWEVLSVTSGGGPSWHGGVDFAVRLTRTAPDLPGGRLTATGKGAGSCSSDRIYVLSLGTD